MNGRMTHIILMLVIGLVTGCASQSPAAQSGMLSFGELGAAITVTRETELPGESPQDERISNEDLIAAAR